MKLHIIATAFNRPVDLKRLIYDLILQTSPDWDLRIIHDGPPPKGIAEWVAALNDPRIEFDFTNVINGWWGHPNRRMMLQELESEPEDYILITNDDNQYVKTFVQMMLGMCSLNVGLVTCDTIHNYYDYDILRTEVRVGKIDMGSFIVRSDIAKEVGFNSIVEVADGIYAEECAAECHRRNLRVIGLRKALFIHN